MKAFGNNLLFVLVLAMVIGLSGCVKEYDESFSLWLVFGSSGSSHFTEPTTLEIYEEAGNAGFATLAELRSKPNKLTITNSKTIEECLSSLRTEADLPSSIHNIIKTIHVIAYEGRNVGYVKFSIISENGANVGFAEPVQGEANSVLGNIAFIDWIKKHHVEKGSVPVY